MYCRSNQAKISVSAKEREMDWFEASKQVITNRHDQYRADSIYKKAGSCYTQCIAKVLCIAEKQKKLEKGLNLFEGFFRKHNPEDSDFKDKLNELFASAENDLGLLDSILD